jgi:hypothetical protein
MKLALLLTLFISSFSFAGSLTKLSHKRVPTIVVSVESHAVYITRSQAIMYAKIRAKKKALEECYSEKVQMVGKYLMGTTASKRITLAAKFRCVK